MVLWYKILTLIKKEKKKTKFSMKLFLGICSQKGIFHKTTFIITLSDSFSITYTDTKCY